MQIDTISGESSLKTNLNAVKAATSCSESMAETAAPALNLSDEFVRRHTRFTSCQVMLDSGNATKTISNGFDCPGWNVFIKQFTDFDNWQELLAAAAEFERNQKTTPEI